MAARTFLLSYLRKELTYMKIKNLTTVKDTDPKRQILLNRGITDFSYLKDTEEHISPPTAFKEELLKKGAAMLLTHITKEDNVFIIVDSDCDGFTSAAILINYLYEKFPAWTESSVEWGMHEGKQHGLNDFIDRLEKSHYKLIICPDSATNDIEAIERLHNNGIDVLILDHHLSDVPMSEYAVTINSQYDYPNTQLSGAGVVYQFCRYLDTLSGDKTADKFIDLAALGDMGDMMSMKSFETKELILKGFKEENIHNPFIDGMMEKQEYSLSKSDYKPSNDNHLAFTPFGAAFYIVPFVNAINRSGTKEEKELIFNSMLTMKAFNMVPSTKRGHKAGEQEQIVTQALRTCTNVKNRQTRIQDAGMELLEAMVQRDNMLQHKVLVFKLNPGQIDRNVAGLCANKMMAAYQRPVCVITQTGDEYSGSMRGYNKTGIESFKEIAESSDACNWSRGHENAAGISLNNPEKFVSDMDEALKDIDTEIVYYVDYEWSVDDVNGDAILALSEMNDYIGTDFDRPLVYIKDIFVNEDNLTVMKSNTLKITLPNKISIIKFSGTDEEIEQLSKGIYINMVCKCNRNEWNWQIDPQLECVNYEIADKKASITEMWGF